MKKLFKRKSAVVPEAQVDVAGLMDLIQQRLDSMEKKLDTLISQSSRGPAEMPFKRRGFGGPYGRGRGRQDSSFGERSMTKVICAECAKECEVPFKPSADRPVYCRECFAKRKGGDSSGARRDNFGGENREFNPKKKPMFRRRK